MRVLALLFIGIVFIYAAFQAQPTATSQSQADAPAALSQPAPAAKPDPHREALAKLKIASFKWGARYSVMTATFTFQNDNDVAVKDVEVRCDHSAPSGTPIDSNTRTIYEIFKPKSRRTIKDFNMGFIHSQAAESGCYVRRLIALG